MKSPGRSLLWFCVACVCLFFVCGCETMKGLGRDFDKLKSWDKEFQEQYW